MIRPYLNGFTIAFNVSQPSTWQPYVDSMHHFLAGKLLDTPEVMPASCLNPCTHVHGVGVSSWGTDQLSASRGPHLEREAHKVVMGASAMPLQVGFSNSLDMQVYSVQVLRNINKSLGLHQPMMTKSKRRRISSAPQDSTSSKGAMKARRRRPASSSAHCCRTALALRTQHLATPEASPASC